MVATALKQGTGKELQKLLTRLTGTIGETLGSLVGREITVRPGQLAVQDPESLLAALTRPCAVAKGALDKGFAGKWLLSLFEIPDAVAMAGLLMMTPEDVVAQRRQKGALEGEDIEAFGELGNVLYSGFGNVLRERVENIDVRMQGQGLVKPGLDEDDVLGDAPMVTFSFHMKIGEFPESLGLLIVDQTTAAAWNKAPLELAGGVVAEPVVSDKPGAGGRTDEDALESIPAAPIRGTMAAFVVQPDVVRTLRLSCRRVGLELRRHGRGEIPNPAAHRNEIVVLDVPPGEDRRFDWCRRIKELSNSTKVVLLIQHPSRPRVTQAFLSRADVILGFPCEETQLSQKLAGLLDGPAGDEPPAE